MKCLVVEDEFSTRLFLQKFLQKYGEVHIAANGREAVEAVHLALSEGEPYDLITMDMMMPEMTGLEALNKIREVEATFEIMSGQGGKIIIVSALSDGKTIISSFKDQCDGYLVKPLDAQKLTNYLEEFKLI